MEQEEPNQSSNQNNSSKQQSQNSDKQKKHHYVLWAVVVIILLVVLAFLWFHHDNSLNGTTESETSTTTSVSSQPNETVENNVTINIRTPKEAVDYVKQKYNDEEWNWKVKEEQNDQNDPTVAKHGTGYHVVAVNPQSSSESHSTVVKKSVYVYNDGTIKEDSNMESSTTSKTQS